MVGCFGGCFGGLLNSEQRKQRKRFLEAAKTGGEDVASVLTQNPEVLSSTTFLARKNALHLAAENGQITVLSSILEALLCQASLGTNDVQKQLADLINSQDAEGRTPLVVACGHGHVECARFLLANGARRNIPDLRGNSAVHYASARGHLGILFTLLGEFLEQLESEGEGQAAAAAAAAAPHASGSGSGSGPGSRTSPSTAAAAAAGVAELDGLVLPAPTEQTAVTRLADARNHAGFSPLHFAVWAKQSAAVQVLLQHGSDLLAKNVRPGAEGSIPCPTGCTPLHLAAMRGHVEISRILLKTYCERVLEPLTVQAGTGPAAAALQRNLTSLDPRSQANASSHVPYQVAQRMGFVSLAVLLRPNIPLMRLFSEEERAARFYGPPPLAILAAEALNRKLLASLNALPASASQLNLPAAPSGGSGAAAAAGTVPLPPMQQQASAPPTLPTVEEEDRSSPTAASAAASLAAAVTAAAASVRSVEIPPTPSMPDAPGTSAASPSGVAVAMGSMPNSPGLGPSSSSSSSTAANHRQQSSDPGMLGPNTPGGSVTGVAGGSGSGQGSSGSSPSGSRPGTGNRSGSGSRHTAGAIPNALLLEPTPSVSPFAAVAGSSGPGSLAAVPVTSPRPLSRQASARNLSQSGQVLEQQAAACISDTRNGACMHVGLPGQPDTASAASTSSTACPVTPGGVLGGAHRRSRSGTSGAVTASITAGDAPGLLGPFGSPAAVANETPGSAAKPTSGADSVTLGAPSTPLPCLGSLGIAAPTPSTVARISPTLHPGSPTMQPSASLPITPLRPSVSSSLSPAPSPGGHFAAAGSSRGAVASLAQRLSFGGGQVPSRPGSPPLHAMPSPARGPTPSLQRQNSSSLPPGVVAIARGGSITLTGTAAAAQRLVVAPAASLPAAMGMSPEQMVEEEAQRSRMPGCLPRFDAAANAAAAAAAAAADTDACCPQQGQDAAAGGGQEGSTRRAANGSLPGSTGAPSSQDALHALPGFGAAARSLLGSTGGLRRSNSHAQEQLARAGSQGWSGSIAAIGGPSEPGTSASLPAVAAALGTTPVPGSSAAAATPHAPAPEGAAAAADACMPVTGIAAPATAAAPAAGFGSAWDDEDECGVCLEHPALVQIKPCLHTICGPCAHKLLVHNLQRAPHCPFCRALLADFSALEQ